MSSLPIIDAKTFEKLLFYEGFKAIRKKGSHVFYRHPDGRYTTLPFHKGQDISKPLIRQILREIDITPEDFVLKLQNI